MHNKHSKNKPKVHQRITAKVTNVIDGDTMEITDDNKIYTIRLWGVDAPEIEQDFGIEAKNYIRKRILNKDADFLLFSVGEYGRNIGQLFVQGTNNKPTDVAAVLVGAGYAHSSIRDDSSEYFTLETRAKMLGSGLWSQPNFMHPKEFREQVTMVEKTNEEIAEYPEEFRQNSNKKKFKKNNNKTIF